MLIIPSANLLILATVICMPLNVNISNYNLGRLNYRTLKYAASFSIDVQFAHHLHIVIIHILNPEDVAVLVDMVRKVQSFFTRSLLAKYSAAQTM